MNDLQSVELDLLKAFLSIANKYNLKYYLVCGSCLGAVKYKGFIPWDDDVDVALPRTDYERFCSVAASELPENVFLQNYRTDPLFPSVSSKLRMVNTSFIETNHKNIDMVHGVNIDVFPLDGMPPESELPAFYNEMKEITRKRVVNLNYKRFSAENLVGIRTNLYYLKSRLLPEYRNTLPVVQHYDELISSFSEVDNKIWCNHHEEYGPENYNPAEWYGNGVEAEFEGLKVIVPAEYDKYLTKRYGDWRADLPPEEQIGHHFAEVIDLNRPYTDYIVKLKNGRIRMKTAAELKRDGINPPKSFE